MQLYGEKKQDHQLIARGNLKRQLRGKQVFTGGADKNLDQ